MLTLNKSPIIGAMMKAKIICVAYAAIFLLISGCSSIEVSENYDTSYDFTKLKTYDWIPVENKKNKLTVKQIQNELKNQLAAKGFRTNASNPDFLIALHGGTEEKVSIRSTNYGYNYGHWYGGSHGATYYTGGVEVYEYKEGTLILDIIDAKNKEVIFQSTTITTLSDNMSMEKRQKKIKQVIEKAIKAFPPSVRKK